MEKENTILHWLTTNGKVHWDNVRNKDKDWTKGSIRLGHDNRIVRIAMNNGTCIVDYQKGQIKHEGSKTEYILPGGTLKLM